MESKLSRILSFDLLTYKLQKAANLVLHERTSDERTGKEITDV